MIITTLAVLALSAAPSDTPIEPIPESIIRRAVATPEWQPICDAYGELVQLTFALTDNAEMQVILVDMVDQYMLNAFEDGFGPTSELTVEAEELLLTEMHSCVLGGVS